MNEKDFDFIEEMEKHIDDEINNNYEEKDSLLELLNKNLNTFHNMIDFILYSYIILGSIVILIDYFNI